MSLFDEYTGTYNFNTTKLNPQIFDYTGKKITRPTLFMIAEIMGDITVIGGTFEVPVMLLSSQTRIEFYGTTFNSFVEDNLGARFYGCTFNADLDIDCLNSFVINSELNSDAAIKNAHNCVIFRNRIKSENPLKIINSSFITIAENDFRGSGGIQLDASMNTLITNNIGDTADGKPEVIFSSDRYSELEEAAEANVQAQKKDSVPAFKPTPEQLNAYSPDRVCEAYGNDISLTEYTQAGADERKLPPIDRTRFYRFTASDTITFEKEEFSLNECIKRAVKEGKKDLVIPPGIYRVFADENSSAHIELRNMCDFTIYGYGAFLIFEDYTKTAFRLTDCRNVAIKGITADYHLISNTQGKVVRTDGEYAELEIDKLYPDLLENEYFYYQNPRAAECFRKNSDRPFCDFWNIQLERLPNSHVYRFTNTVGLDVDDKIVFRGRFAHVNHFIRCHGIVYEDVTLFGGSGFGVMEEDGSGTILNRLAFVPGPKPFHSDAERLISVCDATHSTNMRIGIKVTNSVFCKMTDDAANVNGTFGYVDREHSGEFNGCFRLAYTGNCTDFLEDDSAIISTFNGRMLYRGRVSNSVRASDTPELRYIILPVTVELPDEKIIIENESTNGVGFVYENCVVNNNRSRGLLIKAPEGIIRHCTLVNNGMSAILVRPETTDNWGECGFVRNLLIEDNLIVESGFFTGSDLHSPINISSDSAPSQDPAYHNQQNITLRGNQIYDRYSAAAVYINGSHSVLIEGNRFGTLSSTAKKPSAAPAIKIEGSSKIKLRENSRQDNGEPEVFCDNETTLI